MCAGRSHSVCGASSLSPGNGYILGFSIINLASRHCVSPASDRSPHLSVGSVWTALYVRYSYYREERSMDRTLNRASIARRNSIVSLWEDPRFLLFLHTVMGSLRILYFTYEISKMIVWQLFDDVGAKNETFNTKWFLRKNSSCANRAKN